jgi:serine/threonine protein kinase
MPEKLNRYEIVEEIGQGGFATVYRALDTELDRSVALKELKPFLLQDEGWVRRFRREAKAIARLDHPRIVAVYDVGESDDRLFIVMRLVDGPSLEELIVERGRLIWDEAVQYMAALAEGLDYAHNQGVLHRDLKPANILMDPERGPQLTDFGLAKLAGEHSLSMSASGSVVGTPHYIAPEVWEGQSATTKADIYALGCILYEMITGEKVFKGETPPAVMMAHFKPLELPPRWPEGVPAGLSEVLKTALATQPARRYANAVTLVDDLITLAEDRPVAVTPAPPEAAQNIPETRPDTAVHTGQDVAEAQDASQQPVQMEQPSASLSPVDPAPPSDQPAAQSPAPQPSSRIKQKRRKSGRSGCGWLVGLGIVGLVLLAGIGLGGFCSAAGGLLTLGNIYQSLPTVDLGPTQVKEIFVPAPDGSDPIEVDLKFDTGGLFLAPGAKAGLIEGTATFNVPQLEPRLITSSGIIRLEHETALGLANITAHNAENTWELKLGPQPMALDVEANLLKESRLELGGLSLRDLTINPGAGDITVLFSNLNPVEMSELVFQTHAAEATLTNLANAHAREINLDVTAGAYTLDFGGTLQNDTAVNVSATSLSEITIIVPEEVAAQVSVISPESALNIEGNWEKSGRRYSTPGGGYQIIIEVDIGAGTLNLRTR